MVDYEKSYESDLLRGINLRKTQKKNVLVLKDESLVWFQMEKC